MRDATWRVLAVAAFTAGCPRLQPPAGFCETSGQQARLSFSTALPDQPLTLRLTASRDFTSGQVAVSRVIERSGALVLQLDSRHLPGGSVEVVARYGAGSTGVRALALHSADGKRMSGTADGRPIEPFPAASPPQAPKLADGSPVPLAFEAGLREAMARLSEQAGREIRQRDVAGCWEQAGGARRPLDARDNPGNVSTCSPGTEGACARCEGGCAAAEVSCDFAAAACGPFAPLCFAGCVAAALACDALCNSAGLPCCPVACSRGSGGPGSAQNGCCCRGETCLDSSLVQAVCCAGDTTPCHGQSCCKNEVEQCLPDGSCCPNGQACNGTCCAPGSACTGGRCCPPPGSPCGESCCGGFDRCVDPGRGLCCPPAKICNGACCADGEACTAAGCCPAGRACGQSCCGPGSFCSDASRGTCSPNPVQCTPGESPCFPGGGGQGESPICCPTGSTCCAGPPAVCCAPGAPQQCHSAMDQPTICRGQRVCASGRPNVFCSSDADCPGSFCPTVDAVTCRSQCVQ